MTPDARALAGGLLDVGLHQVYQDFRHGLILHQAGDLEVSLERRLDISDGYTRHD